MQRKREKREACARRKEGGSEKQSNRDACICLRRRGFAEGLSSKIFTKCILASPPMLLLFRKI